MLNTYKLTQLHNHQPEKKNTIGIEISITKKKDKIKIFYKIIYNTHRTIVIC